MRLQAPAVRDGVYAPSEEDSAELPEAGPHLDPPDHGEPPQVLLFTGCSLVIRPQVALQLSRVEGFVRRNKMTLVLLFQIVLKPQVQKFYFKMLLFSLAQGL